MTSPRPPPPPPPRASLQPLRDLITGLTESITSLEQLRHRAVEFLEAQEQRTSSADKGSMTSNEIIVFGPNDGLALGRNALIRSGIARTQLLNWEELVRQFPQVLENAVVDFQDPRGRLGPRLGPGLPPPSSAASSSTIPTVSSTTAVSSSFESTDSGFPGTSREMADDDESSPEPGRLLIDISPAETPSPGSAERPPPTSAPEVEPAQELNPGLARKRRSSSPEVASELRRPRIVASTTSRSGLSIHVGPQTVVAYNPNWDISHPAMVAHRVGPNVSSQSDAAIVQAIQDQVASDPEALESFYASLAAAAAGRARAQGDQQPVRRPLQRQEAVDVGQPSSSSQVSSPPPPTKSLLLPCLKKTCWTCRRGFGLTGGQSVWDAVGPSQPAGSSSSRLLNSRDQIPEEKREALRGLLTATHVQTFQRPAPPAVQADQEAAARSSTERPPDSGSWWHCRVIGCPASGFQSEDAYREHLQWRHGIRSGQPPPPSS